MIRVTADRNLFETLAESAPDAILIIDEESVILFANSSTKTIFGYEPVELIGQSLLKLIPERLRPSHNAGIARYLSTGRRNIPWTGVELPGLHKNGNEIPVEISFGELRQESGEIVFSGFVRDISERIRQREEVTRAREEKDAALAELNRIGSVIDVALAKDTYDAFLSELLGRLRNEMNADAAAVYLLNTEQRALRLRAVDSPSVELEWDLEIPVGRGIVGEVAANNRPTVVPDISVHEVASPALAREMRSVAAVPVRSGNEVIGVLQVASRAAHTFSPADIRLFEIVAERMAGVFARTRLFEAEQELTKKAEAAVRTRDEVLSIVSHDLRNPVSTVEMSAALLQDSTIQLSDEERRKQLEVISRSAKRMNRLIQDLLDVARIESGRLTITCKCEEPGLIASEAVEAFRGIALEKHIELKCSVAASLKKINADRDRLLQVLSNYLNNAVKFTPEGGTVSLTAQSVADDTRVQIAVADTGPGISAEDLPNVFTKFWQARATSSLGSGLGLAIARGIAEAHNASVAVDSTPGKGSTFYLEIPYSAECG